jgi:hypothetical protein
MHGCPQTVAPPFGGLDSARAFLQTTPLAFTDGITDGTFPSVNPSVTVPSHCMEIPI